MRRKVFAGNEWVEYELTVKHVAKMYLRVSKKMEILVSIPYGIEYEIADRFVQSKYSWVKSRILAKQNELEHKARFAGQDEKWTLFEGKVYPIEVRGSAKVSIGFENDVLLMNVSIPEDEVDFKATILEWRKKTAKVVFTEITAGFFEHFAERGFTFPAIKIKKMKSRWGSYSRRTHTINLNSELLKTPPECIEYIIMHELCHLEHFHHGAEFYALFDSLMPDEKLREKLLVAFCKKWEII